MADGAQRGARADREAVGPLGGTADCEAAAAQPLPTDKARPRAEQGGEAPPAPALLISALGLGRGPQAQEGWGAERACERGEQRAAKRPRAAGAGEGGRAARAQPGCLRGVGDGGWISPRYGSALVAR